LKIIICLWHKQIFAEKTVSVLIFAYFGWRTCLCIIEDIPERMYQPPLNNPSQYQIKKTTGRKPGEVSQCFGNGKKQKNTSNIPPGNSKVSSKKQGYNKQLNNGQREKTFSKNERKIGGTESRNEYMDQNFHFSDEFAAHNLLNFHYSTTGRNVESTNPRRYQVSRKAKTYFNKEAYLQAKCQFVVTGSADNYLLNAYNPDKLVDWENIHFVYFPSHEAPNCPICLYTPVAAKITRCGHVFCWSCLLHYLQLSDKAWAKCPICHEAVHQKDLKSVKPYIQRKYARLDTISMKLMRRPKGSVFVSVANEGDSVNAGFSNWIDYETESYNVGSKLLLASADEILKHILLRQHDELEAQLDIDLAEDNGEDVFIRMALEMLEEEIKSFELKGTCELPIQVVETSANVDASSPVLENDNTLSEMLNNFTVSKGIADATFSDGEFLPSTVADTLATVEVHNASPPDTSCSTIASDGSDCNDQSLMSPSEEHTHSLTSAQEATRSADSYFYQAEDGQNIFLHSINARCLIEEYGSLICGPGQIDGQIVDLEFYTMTKELRKRFRYLSHLPLCSEFMTCELMLKPPVLSKHTIHNFMPEFKSRKANRVKKFKEQQKHDRLATAAGNKEHGFRYTEEYDPEDEIDLSNNVEFPSNLSPGSEREEPGTSPQQFQGVSFAQMLNKKTETTSPPKNEYTAERTFMGFEPPPRWPPRDQQPTNDGLHGAPKADDDDCGPDVFAPNFKATFSAAMFAAAAAPQPTDERAVVAEGGNKKKKNNKKNNKGLLLFGTGGQRKY